MNHGPSPLVNSRHGSRVTGSGAQFRSDQHLGKVSSPPLAVHRPVSTAAVASAVQKKARLPQAPHYVIQQTPHMNGRQEIKAVAPGGVVAGSVHLQAGSNGNVRLSNLSIGEHYRGQGLGGRLVHSALQAARSRGVASVQLEARPSDSSISTQSLCHMYQKLGFRNAGLSPRGNQMMECAIQPRMQPGSSTPKLARTAPPIYRPNLTAQAKPSFSPHPHFGGVVQRMDDSFLGRNVGDRDNTWALGASYHPGNLSVQSQTSSLASSSGTHAEGHALAELTKLYDAGERNFQLDVTRSPCTSQIRFGFPATGTGCTEKLILWKRDHLDANLTVVSDHLYGGNQASNNGRAASVFALYALKEAGIGVALLNPWFQSVRDKVHEADAEAVGKIANAEFLIPKVVATRGGVGIKHVQWNH